MITFASLLPLLGSIITSLVVGFGSAWLASQKAVAVATKEIEHIREKQNDLAQKFESARMSEREFVERMVRQEVKLDLLLESSKRREAAQHD